MKRPGYPVPGERWDFIEYRKDRGIEMDKAA